MLYIDTLLDDNNSKSNDSSGNNNGNSEKLIKLQDIGINMNQADDFAISDADTQQSIALDEHEILDITHDSTTASMDTEDVITLNTAILDDINKDDILLNTDTDLYMPAPPNADTQQSIALNEHEILDITHDSTTASMDTEDVITLDTAILDDINKDDILLNTDTDLYMPAPPNADTQQSIALDEHEILDITHDSTTASMDTEDVITLNTAILDDINKDDMLLNTEIPTDTDLYMPAPPNADTQQSIALDEHEMFDITHDSTTTSMDTEDVITLNTAILDDINKDDMLLNTEIPTDTDLYMPAPPNADTQQSIALDEHEILDITHDSTTASMDTEDVITLDTAILDDINKDDMLLNTEIPTDTDLYMPAPHDADTQQSITLDEHEILDITHDSTTASMDAEDDNIEHPSKHTTTIQTTKNNESVDILYKYLDKIPKEFRTTYLPKDNLMKGLIPQDYETQISNFRMNSASKYEDTPSSNDVQDDSTAEITLSESEISTDTSSRIIDTKSQEYETSNNVESTPSQEKSEEQGIPQNNITLTSDSNESVSLHGAQESEHSITFPNIDMKDVPSYIAIHTLKEREMASIKLLDKDIYNQIDAVDEQLTNLEIRVSDYIDEKKYFQLQLKRMVNTKIMLQQTYSE